MVSDQGLGRALHARALATVDLEMKRKALEQARPIDHATTGGTVWRSDASILTWLEAL